MNDSTDTGTSSATPTGGSGETRRTWIWWVIGAVALVAVLAFVFLANGTVDVPQTVGMTQEQAAAALTQAGLRVGSTSEVETLTAEPDVVVSQSPVAGEEVREGTAVDLAVATVPVVTVPDLVGVSSSEASALLAVEGLRVGEIEYVYDDTVDAGFVTSQEPEAGTQTTVAEFVNLTVSKGREQGEVPNVLGLPSDDAESAIEAAGFEVTTIKESSDSVPAGDVSDQSPDAGVVADAGSLVTLTVSTGPVQEPEPSEDAEEPSGTEDDQAAKPDDTEDDSQSGTEDTAKPDDGESTKPDDGGEPEKPSSPEVETVAVPNVVGAGVLDAIGQLKSADLKIGFAFVSSSEYLLRVAAQDPAADSDVEVGTVVTISIGLPPFLFGEEPPPSAETLPAPAPEGGSDETSTAP